MGGSVSTPDDETQERLVKFSRKKGVISSRVIGDNVWIFKAAHFDGRIKNKRGNFRNVKRECCLIKLKLLEESCIVSPGITEGDYKCKIRTDKAEVMEIIGVHFPKIEILDKVYSAHDVSFTYQIGQIVIPKKPLDTDVTEECGSGIHGFPIEKRARELADKLRY